MLIEGRKGGGEEEEERSPLSDKAEERCFCPCDASMAHCEFIHVRVHSNAQYSSHCVLAECKGVHFAKTMGKEPDKI